MGRIRRAPRPPLPRFAVAWFPSFEGLDRVEAFRRCHDPMASLIAAHLTLVFPFATVLKRIQVESHVPYAPHITIARYREVVRVESALEEARELSGREMDDVLREVALLAVAPDGRIERLSTLPLDCA